MSFNPLVINSRTYDFTSIRCSGLPLGFDSTLFTQHLMGISFSETVTPSVPAGVHGIPLPRGRGFYTCSTSLEMVWDAWDFFTKTLAQNGINGYSDFDFDLLIQYKTQGRTCKVEWKESSFLAPSGNHSRGGASGLTVNLGFYTRYILTNGVCAYPLDLDQDLSTLSSGGVSLGI